MQVALSKTQIASQRADDDGVDSDDDEDENFDKTERTQKHDDLETFAKLMRQRIEPSMLLILNRYEQLL